MFTVKTNKKSTIVIANNFVVGAGYKRMLELAEAYKGKVDTDTKTKLAKITFGDTSKAKTFVTEFTSEYTKAHKAYTKQTKSAQGKGKATKPTSSSKKTTKKGKGDNKGFDFNSVKGKTKAEKNKSLHAILVGMGHADSRTPEYMSVWNARPWAK